MPIEDSQPSVSGTNKNSAPSETKEFTPTKLLHEVSPIPVAPIPLFKRRKQGASVLTSPLNIENLKVRIINKTTKKCEKMSKEASGKRNCYRLNCDLLSWQHGAGSAIQVLIRGGKQIDFICNLTTFTTPPTAYVTAIFPSVRI
ncbi:hypothetical protein NQ318_005103 [Aromia moschata]|uniref:Uncharacterized protein n=1 Tax=Aromia moschata TaxID=1265417 RepID=A0AAV8YGI5_9CUCU|nr:hypothetical protein NQ318_005103 [Aromia moschata]